MSIKFFACPSTQDAYRVVQVQNGMAAALVPQEQGGMLLVSNIDLAQDWRFTRYGLRRIREDAPHPVLKIKFYRSEIPVEADTFTELLTSLGYEVTPVTVPEKVEKNLNDW